MRAFLTHPVISGAIVLTVVVLLWLGRWWARDARLDVTKVGRRRRNYVINRRGRKW